MQKSSIFQVYNASAGSGKTFTLVKEYLKILLQTEDVFRFQKILAITFTNKAAGEMKERVLSSLQDFSEGKTNDLLEIVLEETSIDKEVLKERSKKILDAILQNYAAFSITTIDSFTHKIIKSFAYDLGLPLNFEVEMDAVSLLNEAVDVLISKIGTDKELTKLLIDFSLDKTDDDKSWDISRELNEFSKILLNEDDTKHFRKLSNTKIEDFFKLKNKLISVNNQLDKSFKEIGEKALNLINKKQLKFTDFAYSGECPKHFVKLLNYKKLKADDLKFEGRIDKNFNEGKKLYSAKASEFAKSTIDYINNELKELYLDSKELFEKSNSVYVLNRLALKSIIPLAVLNNINSELNSIKEDNNLRLNAEFNQLISDNIKDQPAPFIYERIGQRFMHYFIDEMQDTSVLQWKNLIPLIDNALAQENSNLLLVGDGKQAIYRWRGGKAEQFIRLGSEEEKSENPFHISKEVRELDRNFRSYSEVVNFNNKFFLHTADFLQNEKYKKLFIDGNKQLENAKKGGYVSLSFLEKQDDKEEEKLKYPRKILAKIKELQNEFSLGEICVLTRKRKDGVAVANYLSENGINIVSSETLLLQNSSKVNFIINLLKVIQHQNDKETLLEVLYFLFDKIKAEDKHSFISKHIGLSNEELFETLTAYAFTFELANFNQLPFYEKMEEIVRGFQLVNSSDAYVQFFLEVVLEQQRRGTSIADFLEFWEQKKNSLSIVAPDSNNAVQVMTIHKSKGLEFPVVIFPYDLDIYRQVNPKVWLNNLPKETFENFNELLVPFNKDLNYISDASSEIYQQQREELELDNFNLLYVALTRAVEQLHIITEKKLSKTGENTNFYSGVFINYLKKTSDWNDEVLEYSFGNFKRRSLQETQDDVTEIHQGFITTSWKQQNIQMLASASKLWDTEQGEAIEYGNLIHEILSKIITKEDVSPVLNQYLNQGIINIEEQQLIEKSIHKIINHPQLKYYFSKEVTVFNEREIVDVDNQIIIPDRLVFTSRKEVVIIDYKTGKPDKKHHQQLLKYAQVLMNMNFKVDKKLLVYVDAEILIEEV